MCVPADEGRDVEYQNEWWFILDNVEYEECEAFNAAANNAKWDSLYEEMFNDSARFLRPARMLSCLVLKFEPLLPQNHHWVDEAEATFLLKERAPNHGAGPAP